MMDRELLRADLVRDEGLKLKAYKDTVGKMTLGVGHNIDDKPITMRVAMYMLDDDIDDVLHDLDRALPWWNKLSEPRQRVLANMCFNLGIARLLNFQKALDAMHDGNFALAADEMLSSRWAVQVGFRARRLANAMRGG